MLDFVSGEWVLKTEPWVFLIDQQGLVSAKFEAIVSYGELEEALAKISE